MSHAENELIERDAFMWHFLSEQKFQVLQVPDALKPCTSLPGRLGLSRMNTPRKIRDTLQGFTIKMVEFFWAQPQVFI
jgi:hypothetical protein